jgi:hypothetical protein
MNRRMKDARLALLSGALLALIGCTSPEATRTRGGGPGADVGNRKEEVRTHLGSQPYWDTPVLIPAKHPPLDGANQAAQLAAHDDRSR